MKTLFVHSNKDIGEILKNHIKEEFDFGIEDGEYCYLAEEREIEKEDVILLYKDLYKHGYEFYVSLENRENAERDSYESDYEHKCVIHEFLPKEYINADTGVKKLCAYIFHSKKENISMKESEK